jgi:hypothetical protein
VGFLRWARAAGIASATIAGLELSQQNATAWGAKLAIKLQPDLSDIAFWKGEHANGPFIAYVLILVITLGVLSSYAVGERLLSHLLRRWKPAGLVAPVLMTIGALFLTRSRQTYWHSLVPAMLLGISLVVYPHVGRGGPRPVAASRRAAATYALAIEFLALAWGAWLTTTTIPTTPGWGQPSYAPAAVLIAASYSGYRLRAVLSGGERALVLEALVGAPLLLLPFLGLLRSPSPWFCVGAVAIGMAARQARVQHALRTSMRRLTRRESWPLDVDSWLAGMLAPVALGAILIIPLQMRDLPTINVRDHEAQFLGWVSSALNGKMLGAQASTFYGPLRIYMMTAWCLFAGVNVLQMRVAFVLVNIVGLAICMRVGWDLLRRNLWVHLWYGMLVVVMTPLWMFLAYKDDTALGWADLSRPAWSLLAIAGAMRACANLPPGVVRKLPQYRSLALWGAATIAATLYSQEYGLCALVALILVLPAHRAAAAGPIGLRGRSLAALFAVGAFLAGALVASLLWLLPYAVRGCAGQFLGSLSHVTGIVASGAWGSRLYPVHESSFASAAALRTVTYGAPVWEYMLVPAVYVVSGAALVARLFRGGWNARFSALAAIELFGAATYRVAMARADTSHLIGVTLPAVLLACALAVDMAPVTLRLFGTRFGLRIGSLAVMFAMAVSLNLSFVNRLISRIDAIARHDEGPSKGPKYQHPNLPRGGDVAIPAWEEELAVFVKSTTTPDDYIFCRVGPMTGPEFYFLTGRKNSTRFDLLAETATLSIRHEAVEDFKRHPPRLVIGNYNGIGEEIEQYLRAWKPLKTFKTVTVYARDPLHP